MARIWANRRWLSSRRSTLPAQLLDRLKLDSLVAQAGMANVDRGVLASAIAPVIVVQWKRNL